MPEESQVVFSTKFFAIEEVQSRALDQPGSYFRLVGPDSSLVCVFDHQSIVLLVKQFRPSIDDYTLEFPAGAVDPGETALEAAQREALEETGYRIELATLGSHYHLLTNRTNIKMHLHCGRTLEQEPAYPPEAGLQLAWFSRDELLKASLDGRFRQLGGLGLLQVLSGVIGQDVWRCSNGDLQSSLDKLFMEPLDPDE